ncbi:MAG TPA: hypothetical protein VGH74_07665, partial [Planctomycetaceae bacterium]
NAEPFQKWRDTGMRMVNLHDAAAIAEATGLSKTQAIIASMFGWRLGQGVGRWCKKNEDFARDVGVSTDLLEKIRDALMAKQIVKRGPPPPGRHPSMYSYWLEADFLSELAYDYGVRNGHLAQPIMGPYPLVAVMTPSPVDNSGENEGHTRYYRHVEPPVAVSTNKVKNHIKPNSRARESMPADVREPGTDDEIEPTSEPNDSANAIDRSMHAIVSDYHGGETAQTDLQRAVAILDEVVERHAVPVAPGAVSSLCQRHGITPAVATALAQKADSNAQPIRTFSWFDTVAPGVRDKLREAKPRGHTPVGVHASHLANDVLRQWDADDAAFTGPTDKGAEHAAELRARLRYGNRKE